MAFLRYAYAKTIQPDIKVAGWEEIRRAGNPFVERAAAKVVFTEFSPNDYMLSHCTIIASVDAEPGNAPLGKSVVDGFQINRKYPDWLVTQKTAKYINNNNDAWERKLLLSCFRTFIGGENYVEHIQIPEFSRGKIIDAAARDIGDSIYVDILVATHRKHQPLIASITSGALQTLSMGCQVEFTICTKCGNVAYDETQLCPHVRFAKGTPWKDAAGNERIVAELCGHIEEEPGSVKFIEASWVGNPAFTGAVLRNILNPREAAIHEAKLKSALAEMPRVPNLDLFQKAAYQLKISQYGDQGDQGSDPAPKKKPEKSPFDSAVDDLADHLREKAVEKVRGEIHKDESPLRDENQNDTLIKSALRNPVWREMARAVIATVGTGKPARKTLLGLILLKTGGWEAVRSAKLLTGREILALSRMIDLAHKRTIMAGEGRIYRTIVAVGGTSPYRDEAHYMAACRRVLGRDPTQDEKRVLLVKGQLFSFGA